MTMGRIQSVIYVAKPTSGNTSNMLKHLKSKHEEEYKEVNEQQEEAKRLKSDAQSGSTILDGPRAELLPEVI